MQFASAWASHREAHVACRETDPGEHQVSFDLINAVGREVQRKMDTATVSLLEELVKWFVDR